MNTSFKLSIEDLSLCWWFLLCYLINSVFFFSNYISELTFSKIYLKIKKTILTEHTVGSPSQDQRGDSGCPSWVTCPLPALTCSRAAASQHSPAVASRAVRFPSLDQSPEYLCANSPFAFLPLLGQAMSAGKRNRHICRQKCDSGGQHILISPEQHTKLSSDIKAITDFRAKCLTTEN